MWNTRFLLIEDGVISGLLMGIGTLNSVGVEAKHFQSLTHRRVAELVSIDPTLNVSKLHQLDNYQHRDLALDMAPAVIKNIGMTSSEFIDFALELKETYLNQRLSDLLLTLARDTGPMKQRLARAQKALRKAERILNGSSKGESANTHETQTRQAVQGRPSAGERNQVLVDVGDVGGAKPLHSQNGHDQVSRRLASYPGIPGATKRTNGYPTSRTKRRA